MLGSTRRELCKHSHVNEVRIYSVALPGETLWGWERRSDAGELIARTATLFRDYVTCLCEAQRHA